jgi:hypothetical protein
MAFFDPSDETVPLLREVEDTTGSRSAFPTLLLCLALAGVRMFSQ